MIIGIHLFSYGDVDHMYLSKRRILITGGPGFIRSHLAENLLETNNEVLIIDNFSNSTQEWIPSDAAVIEGDLTNRETVEKVVTPDLDVMFHLAARKDPNDDNPRGQFAKIPR